MEAVILVVIIVVTVFVARLTSRRHVSPPPNSSGADRQRRPTPRVFDPRTAKPQSPTQVIEGPAYVVDGDTVKIRKTQIRLFGIDAPEMNHPYGKKAKWALVSLCKGKTVRAEVTEVDAYGRTVAKCYLPDGRDLSAEMVKQGLAIDWAKFSGGKYRGMETSDARKKLWLAVARQKGQMHVWEQFDYDNYRARASQGADQRKE